MKFAYQNANIGVLIAQHALEHDFINLMEKAFVWMDFAQNVIFLLLYYFFRYFFGGWRMLIMPRKLCYL